MSGKSKLGELEARLAALGRAAEEGFGMRAAELRAVAERLERGDDGAREELRRLAHKLRGIAGSVGHPALSERAARLENAAATASDVALLMGARRLADAAEQAIDASAPEATAGEKSAPAPRRLGLRVVALDDDATTRRLLAITLAQVGGCDADVTHDPSRALELVRGGGIELVIVDAMMPELNGLELYRAVRREVGPALPVVILSAATPGELGWSLPDDRRLTWLRKPFRPAQLVEELAAFVRVE